MDDFVFGAVASSALIIGAAIGVWFKLPKRLLAMLLAFAAGALITALSFELFEDSYERGGIWLAAIGLFVGAMVFTVLSALLDRWAQPGSRPKPADEYQGSVKLDTDAAAADRPATAASTRGTAGLALLGGGDPRRCSGESRAGHLVDRRNGRHRVDGCDLRLEPAGGAGRRGIHA